MSEQTNSIIDTAGERQKQIGLWAAGIITAMSAAFMAVSIYAVVWQGRFYFEDAILMPATVILTIGGLLSHFFIRQGRYKTGSELLFIALMIMPVIATLVLSNILMIGIAFTVIFAPLMVNWILLKTSRRLALVTIALVILAFIGIEVWNPGFRGLSDVAVNVTPFVIALAAVVLLVFIVRPLWMRGNIQTKIVLWAGTGFFLSAAFIIGYAAFTLRREISRSAEDAAQKIAREKAAEIRTALERTLSAAETFTQSVAVVKTEGVQLSREQVNAMLRQLLKDNPQFVGVDVLWEPNAFDGMDAEFANTEGSDVNGRFVPYWTRGTGGEIRVELLQDYDTSDWYQCPKLTKVPCLIDPLVYPVQGKDVLMTSVVVPFVVDGTFYGITGIDTPVSFLQDLADKADVFNGAGSVIILSNNGTILGVTGRPELIGQPATALHDYFSAEDYQAIKNGEEKVEFASDGNERLLEVFTPIQVGGTTTPWSVNVSIPQEVILADAAKQMWNMIGIGSGLLVLSLVALFYVARQIAQPIRKITEVAQMVTSGDLDVVADVKSADETGVLANAFNQMTAQLRDFIGTLESRVAERTRNLQLAAEVGRTVSQVRSLDVMLTDAAELIRKQFNLYYVQVYLTDSSQSNLILQAGTGKAGEQLLERAHSLSININSINGRAAAEKKSVVISDTTASATFKPNPLLPDTRSEMAVPLMVGDKVVGVLDMQSEKAGSLSQENLAAFEALAGQLAIAIQNANLLEEARQARAEVEAQARRLSRSNWAEYLDAVHKPEEIGFVFEKNQIVPLTQEQAVGENATAVPIAVTGEKLGKLVVEMEGQPPIARAEELIDTVARQVAQHIENLRLLDSAERFRFEAEQASRRLTHEGWQEYLETNATKASGYVYDLNEVRPYGQDEAGQMEKSALNLPLKVRDETVGKIVVKGVEDEDAIGLVNVVAERLGQHIEGLRLAMQTEQALAATRKQAQREQALRQITSAVRSSTDPATILRSAARELGNLLGRQTIVQMETAGKAKTGQADHPSEGVGEAVANNGNESVSSADRS